MEISMAMLTVKETTTLEDALKIVAKQHKLKSLPEVAKEVYRPFWIGKALYSGEKRDHQKVAGTIVFWADARMLQWSILGAYQHQDIDNILDLRPFKVNLVIEESLPSESATVLEPLLTKEQIPTHAKLMRARRTLARALKVGRINYDPYIEYHLVYRPYWEIQFENCRGKTDYALVSRDDMLIRSR